MKVPAVMFTKSMSCPPPRSKIRRERAESLAEEPNSMPLKVEQEIPSTDKAEPNASANVESNPVYANSMEEVTAPKTGFTEEKGAFDIGLLIAFPIMIGTLGFFLFFPYLAPQLAANSP